MQAALRNRCRVYLEVPNQGVVVTTQVEQITNEEVIIAQPSIGGMTYPLAFGEALKLSFVDQKSNLSGVTKCLGRTKVQAGDGRTLFAYRLALPESIKSEERRADPRTEITQEVAPEATLYSGTMKSPIVGRLTNISMSGARVSMEAAPPGLSIGQELYLKFQMPDPIGVVDEVIEIRRLEYDRRCSKHTVGVSFRTRLDRVEALMRIPIVRPAATPPTPGAATPPPQRKSA
jgi:c-di-GMP-binding flagellar brake protein YcgR